MVPRGNMADGDVVLNQNVEVDSEAGTRVELFAVEDSTNPGRYHYRFQYYAEAAGEELLRYDNAHDAGIDPHHRHEGDTVARIEFEGPAVHGARLRHQCPAITPRTTPIQLSVFGPKT